MRSLRLTTRGTLHWLVAVLFSLTAFVAACDSDSGNESAADVVGGTDVSGPGDDVASGTDVAGGDVDPGLSGQEAALVGGLAARVNAVFQEKYDELEGLSYEEWTAMNAVSYLEELDFDPAEAAYFDGFVEALDMSEAALATLREKGFVVLPTWARQELMDGETTGTGTGPADIYYRVFAADLPVFVSADSILHAFHRSYDLLMETSETAVLIPALERTLAATAGALDSSSQAGADALFYVAVAAELLETPVAGLPTDIQDEVDRFVERVAAHRIEDIVFLGTYTTIDFSQFIPRGHYTRSDDLKRYFKAMMWLGRTDLVLAVDEDIEDRRPREEAAARALAGALRTSGAGADYGLIDQFYAAFVGRTNALTPLRLLALCDEAGLSDCAGDAAAMEPLYAEEPPPEYSSRVFAGEVPPIAMRFFPQRFGYGSWVTARSTIPRLKPLVPGYAGGRSMARVEDVAFALGADRAATWFAEEMELPYRENLPATLEAAQQTMEELPPTELDPTTYNYWLEALMALAEPTVGSEMPQVMRTAAWHDRKLEAVLASWAELRHDTILVVEQSTGGIGCQYPQGYVEPLPALFTAMDEAAAGLLGVYETEPFASQVGWSPEGGGNVVPFLTHFREVATTLATIAETELAGEPMTAEQLEFLQRTADLHGTGYYGDRQFDGWYPKLFWTPYWFPGERDEMGGMEIDESGLGEALVADVHTDADNGLALEVATGYPGLMVIAIDNGGDRAIYGGPVANFYTFHQPVGERLTDEQWVERVEAADLPARPAFAAPYHAE